MGKVRTHDHKSPKRAGLSSRVPLDALQTVVAPEMVEKEHKELKQSTSALGRARRRCAAYEGSENRPREKGGWRTVTHRAVKYLSTNKVPAFERFQKRA